MSFKLRPFKELVAMSKEKLDVALAAPRAALAQKRAELKMAEIDEKIASLEQKITESATSKDIDFDAIADKIDEIELLGLRKKRFTQIVAQLFP